MNGNTRNKLIYLTLALALLLAISACGTLRVGDLQTKSESIELGDATTARVDVKMGVGELAIDGGASGLMEADFAYNVDTWEPEVSYSVSNGVGRLSVEQPATDGINSLRIPDGDVRYEWELRFNDAVPIDLSIALGAGQNRLNLGDLTLESLEMNTGAGELDAVIGGSPAALDVNTGVGSVVLDLSGPWNRDMDGTIQGGVGELTLRLPGDVGVRVNVQGGLGSVTATGLSRDGDAYVNDLYGDADVNLTIDVQGGVGEINLTVE